ncbi:probable ubiquitin-conjugating enzyme E2 23 [Coccomyxa sp. Obi]|nr:probable ubiquitin-conjugating enzyme E2 23 [Coccomyxa sp. Obi]
MVPKRRNAQAVSSYDVVELRTEQPEGQQVPDHKTIGLVWRTADESDNSMDDVDSDDGYVFDDEDDDGLRRPLEENQAEVVWMADEAARSVGREIKRAEEDMGNLKVVDRCMQQGDVVASAADPLGQTGIVLDVNRDVDVVLSTGEVLEHQSSSYLQPNILYQPGQHVLHKDGWFGRIDEVYVKLTVAFESGALVELTDLESTERPLLWPVKSPGMLTPTVSEASEFYPGQHVEGEPLLRSYPRARILNKAPLHRMGSNDYLRGIIVKVEPLELKTTWFNSLGGADMELAPKDLVQPSVCTPITHLYFCPAYWHLGSIGLWCKGGSATQEPPAELSQVNVAEGSKHGQSSKQGRSKASKHSAAASRSGRDQPSGSRISEQVPCPEVQQLSLDDHTPQSDVEQGAGKSSSAGIGDMSTEKPEAPATESTCPDGDALQGIVDKIVADCINDIVSEDIPGNVAAEGRPVAPAVPPEAEDVQEKETNELAVAESAWGSVGRHGWNAAAAVMNAVGGLGRASAPVQDTALIHGGRRVRHGGKKRGRGSSSRRSGTSQPVPQLKDLPVTAQVLRTYTRATVQWQDGTISNDVDSALLLPVKHTDEHDFYPNSFVIQQHNASDIEGDPEEFDRNFRGIQVGLVKSVNHAQRTATVLWHKHQFQPRRMPGMSCDNPACLSNVDYLAQLASLPVAPQEAPEEEVVSVYTITPSYEYEDIAVGNVVARLDFKAAATEGRLPSAVGSLLRLEGFSALVHWLDGTESMVRLDEVFVIGNDDDFDEENDYSNFDVDSEDSSFYEHEEGYLGVEEHDEQHVPSIGSETDAHFRNTLLLVHGSIRNRTGEDMGDAWRAASVSDIDGSSPRTVGEGAVYEEDAALSISDAAMPSRGASPEAGTVVPPAAATLQGAPAPVSDWDIADDDYRFPHFEVTDADPMGFEAMPIDPASTRPSRSFQRAVLAEWKILKDGLPRTIWVRAFEGRMDVMRAAILGAAGTPYHDQLFFFDIQLSPDHPSSVPKVLFQSHGNRINPNLYNDGKVCLSLLNTWNGRRTEQWDPTTSSILQVLVSIQGLVLVPEPYYNEAGYEKQVGTLEGERNAVVYNESAFLATIRTTLSMLRSPPPPFEPLVLAVFRHRRERLLRACRAYMTGTARVGAYYEAGASSSAADGAFEDVSRQKQEPGKGEGAQQAAAVTTQGFQLVFKGVLPRLEKELNSL